MAGETPDAEAASPGPASTAEPANGSAAPASNPSAAAAPPGHEGHGLKRSTTLALSVGAIGVVFGDIGTSPLYAFHDARGQAAGENTARHEILGVLSLALWAL